MGISGAQSPGQRWTWFGKGNWEDLIRIVATLLLVLLLRWCGIAAAVVGWVSRHFLGDGEEARTDSKRSLEEAFLFGRLGKAAQASAPLGAKLAGGWSREFG